MLVKSTLVVDSDGYERKTLIFQLLTLAYVTAEPTYPIWTDSFVVEQMPTKGRVRVMSLSLSFPEDLATLLTPPLAWHNIFHHNKG